ncbi:hypothetical protein ENCLCK374B_01690 [Enterobacter cloacae]|uniref:hypothetical protein n=1 Tax=Enterobacter cloacae TaxID=550 RepID=UPI003B2350AF
MVRFCPQDELGTAKVACKVVMIGKGLMRAVQVHLTLAVMSLVLTTVYLLTALSGASVPGVSLIAALISIFMLLLSGYCIHSISFYKAALYPAQSCLA